MKREVIHVDENGLTPDGDGFEFAATQEAINQGYMINAPVTLVFPDGRRFDTVQARLTTLGMAVARESLGKEGGAS